MSTVEEIHGMKVVKETIDERIANYDAMVDCNRGAEHRYAVELLRDMRKERDELKARIAELEKPVESPLEDERFPVPEEYRGAIYLGRFPFDANESRDAYFKQGQLVMICPDGAVGGTWWSNERDRVVATYGVDLFEAARGLIKESSE